MGVIREAWHALRNVAADAWRALVAHWPELVVIFALGWAVRMGILWLTTEISDVSPTIAVLVLPFAPMATLLSMILMLRATGPSLGAFQGVLEDKPLRARWNEDIRVAAQVLLPFLVVYASAGLLKEDVNVFLRDSFMDEWYRTAAKDIDFGRALYATGWVSGAMVVGAIAIRKFISFKELASKSLTWAAIATYVESLWIVTLVNVFTLELDKVLDWITSRRAIDSIITWWADAMTYIETWATPLKLVIDAFSAVFANLGTLVVVPVAWLAIGSTVYGHSLNARTFRVETHESITRKLRTVPQPVRRVVGQVTEPVVLPVRSAFSAIGKIANAGFVPMVLFCVAFVLAGQVEALVAVAMRALIGPGEPLRQLAFEPYAQFAARGTYFVLMLVLLGAAVSFVVQRERTETSAASAPAPEAADAPALPTQA